MTPYRKDAVSDLVSMQFLCMESDFHREMPLDQVLSWLATPIQLGQYLMFADNDKVIGFITWAWLDEKTEEKLMNWERFDPSDWVSGKILWFIDYVAPFGHSKEIRKYLRHEVFKDQAVAKCRRGKDPKNKRSIVWRS